MTAKKSTPKPSRRNQQVFTAVIILAVLGVAVVAVARLADKNVFHKSDAATDTHAANAADYMNDQSGIEISTADLAYKVVGHTGVSGTLQTDIAALKASGSNFSGQVILKITVDGDTGAFGSADRAVNCYSYAFLEDTKVTYERLPNCPNLPELQLAVPKTPPDRGAGG